MGRTKQDLRRTPKHVRVFHSLMDTDAWRAMSGNAVKVLLALVSKDNGQRNGELSFSCREAADMTGLSVRTCQRCLIELQDLGFIRCTQKGAFSRKVQHASLWRYTWQAWPEGKMGPTRDFEKWKHGNSRMQVSHATDANLSEVVETHPVTDADIATEETGKSLVSANSRSDRIATHIVYQRDAERELETGQRKQANPDTRADLGFLRNQVAEHLHRHEAGEQSRLANAIPIPAGTLSKFINGGNLPEQYREPLAKAVA